MKLRKKSTVIEVNDDLDIYVLDNGDIFFDWTDGVPCEDVRALQLISFELERSKQRYFALKTAQTITMDTIRGFFRNDPRSNVVSPFYNIVGAGRCLDCDEIEALVDSQWGEDEQVCVPCEQHREFEYGLPPATAKEQ